MDLIHHEQQESRLCAQHALNAALQGPYFTAVELADIARQLDAEEQRMLNGAQLEDPSTNMDDTGYFSVQVISAALAIWNLRIAPYQQAPNEAQQPEVYICHLNEHWLTLRRFGKKHWFNLDSLQPGPQYISTTYLEMVLQQLVASGYVIFQVQGELPTCPADPVLASIDHQALLANATRKDQPASNESKNVAFTGKAFSLSSESPMPSSLKPADKVDHDVKATHSIQDDIRSKRLAYFQQQKKEQSTSSLPT